MSPGRFKACWSEGENKVADKLQIIIKKGPTPGRVVELTADELTIGRESSNSLYIDERSLSRSHARLARSGTGYTIQDLGSTNGTYVNGKSFSGPYTLQNGDIITLSEAVELEFRKIATGSDPNATFVMPAQKKNDATEVLPTRAALQAELAKVSAASHAEEHRALFSRWFEELWNKKNYAITRELVASEFTAHGAGGQDIKQGPDGVAGMVKVWHEAFPDGHMTMDDIVTEGEYSSIRMTFRGTHTGEFYGNPASNKSVEVTSIGIDRVVGGKITEGWGELNMLGMMQQMGVIPGPDSGPKEFDIETSITPEHVGEAYAALSSGDMNKIRQYWADDMVWQVPGHNELSGWYTSRDEFLAFMGKVGEMSDQSFHMDMIAGRVLVTGDYSVDLTRNRGHIKGDANKTMDIEVAHVLRWRDGKVIAGKGAIFGDGATEYDQFWSRSPVVTPPSH
jgi:pSer/pThr/pTyr-binding forkhead associated (FHA) protein/predicted ester cyclase/ketosteroid isomerase-like protein